MLEEIARVVEDLLDVGGSNFSEEDVIYFSHLIVGMLCSSQEAREKMRESIQKISDIIVDDLGRTYN